MSTVSITRHGAKILKEELRRLKTKKRPAAVSAIAEACAQDDLSENADYDVAKERQGFIENRIQEIESKLFAAQIIGPAPPDVDDRAAFGTTIDLEDLDSGKPVTYQAVGDDEADLETGRILINSSVARALIDKFEGDVATAIIPGGEHEYEALTVKYL